MAALLSWSATTLVCGSASGQSLADVARAESERRKAIARPSRVYTNNDLKPVRAPAIAAPGAEPQTGQSASSSPAGDAASPGALPSARDAASPDANPDSDDQKRRAADEQRWRRRVFDAREQVERSRTFAEALQSRINALTADFSARDDPAQRAVIGTQLNTALAELARVQGEIEAQQKAMTDLEDEARRAGVPPGWLR